MAPTLAGDVIRVAARHKFDVVDDVVNVFHFQVLEAPVTEVDSLLVADVEEKLSAAYTKIEDRMNTVVDSVDAAIYNMSQDYPMGTIDWSTGYTGGTSSSESLPPGTAPLILWRTGIKNVTGKTYLPPFTEPQQINGVIVSAARTAMAEFAGELQDTATLGFGYSLRLIVYSRAIATIRAITSVSPQARVAYQRRRKQGRGS